MKNLLVLGVFLMATVPSFAADPNLKKNCVSPTVRVAASPINERPAIEPRKATAKASTTRTATR